jgi:uncharacterized RDD family membrane protein YckC
VVSTSSGIREELGERRSTPRSANYCFLIDSCGLGICPCLLSLPLLRFDLRKPAKYAFNLRVVRHDGLKAGAGAVALRFLLRFPVIFPMLIPAAIPSLSRLAWILQTDAAVAAFVCFFAFKRRTHSDLLTRTRVIYVGSGEPVMPFRRRKIRP